MQINGYCSWLLLDVFNPWGSLSHQSWDLHRVGCFPYIKYHCTKRPVQDLSFENNLYRLITIANLGLPCLLYGLAAVFLIKHTEIIEDEETKKLVRIHFLIKEDHN
ncbi:hypothetical protein DICVIV_00305 [Dictyocaulus viviparus]|uniref:Uncharacterized protein n=1 Tax=Dictyocaulus viviparus TaxID=29172 RepID=A0A0D8Y9Y0_DICVI|nr:hypothetical protein DICVIV_00305 [Dictyocaulus viviparus]